MVKLITSSIRVKRHIIFRKWVAKIGHRNIFGCPTIQGSAKYTQITTINMYSLIEIRHTILYSVMGIIFK